MQVVHVMGSKVRSGYMVLTQLVTQVWEVELVVFKYLKLELELQVKQKVDAVWQVRQFVSQREHLKRVVSAYYPAMQVFKH